MDDLGDLALLRTAGLPVGLWLEAASPHLFGRIRQLSAMEDRYRAQAAAAAAAIGDVLVVHPGLEVAQRRLALAARRRLYRGAAADVSRLRSLADAAAALGRPDLGRQLDRVARLAGRVAAERDRVAEALTAEQDRLLGASWTAIGTATFGRRAMLDGTLAAGEDIERRVRSGASWHSKRMRRRSDYLWRMIARGTAKTTPRGWLGHVTLVPVGGATGSTPNDPVPDEFVPDEFVLDEFVLDDEVAARWTQNVHEACRAAMAEPDLDEATVVGLCPLHRLVDGHLQVWSIHPDRPERLRPVRVRCTPTLARVATLLRAGASPVGRIETALLPAGAGEAPRQALRDFLTRLVGLGVCQVSVPARVRRTGWRRSGAEHAPLAAPDSAGFVDVYRRADTPWPGGTRVRVERAVGLFRRLTAAMDADEPDEPPFPGIGPEPRPVLDVLFERLDDRERAGADGHPRRAGAVWPHAHRPDSAYGRLLDWLDARAEAGTGAVEITPELLDRVGAPPATYAWPLDCLVRPARTGVTVLDVVQDAASLDSRFAAELESLHGPLPQVAAYREFLDRLDAETGVRSVELLLPSLSEWAANAVSRPRYTTMWTGDPDLDGYCPAGRGPGEYVPMERLTVRHPEGGRLLVEADGRPVRILYHATRTPPPPWNALTAVLVAGSTPLGRYRRLRHSLAALPDRSYLPRIALPGSVVVSPAQWKIRPRALWDAEDTLLVRAQKLTRLRDRLNLPRWVMVCPSFGGRPVPCDLESLRALTVLATVAELVLDATPEDRPDDPASVLVVEEMVPAPDELVVRDPACGRGLVAAELMLRLPSGRCPAALARASARAFSGTPEPWPADGPEHRPVGAALDVAA